MPFDTPSTLKTEISKLAKRSNIQNGLPPSMRGLPVLAIMAGGAIAKATNSNSNAVEDRMLGNDEAVLLAGPSSEKAETSHKQEPDEARTGDMKQPDGS